MQVWCEKDSSGGWRTRASSTRPPLAAATANIHLSVLAISLTSQPSTTTCTRTRIDSPVHSPYYCWFQPPSILSPPPPPFGWIPRANAAAVFRRQQQHQYCQYSRPVVVVSHVVERGGSHRAARGPLPPIHLFGAAECLFVCSTYLRVSVCLSVWLYAALLMTVLQTGNSAEMDS